MYMGIDLGTSAVKTVIIDDRQKAVASASAPIPVNRPRDGFVEQDPDQWIHAVEQTFATIEFGQGPLLKQVKGIGLSGHMHGATLVGQDDSVLRPCILWNDTRSHAEAAELDTPQSRQITGNILFPGFTAPKLAWVQRHEPEVFTKIKKVLLPKDYVRLWLSGDHVSDCSDSAGTGWLDVSRRSWSTTLLEANGLAVEHMPRLIEGTDVSGELRPALAEKFGFEKNVLIAGGAGDNAASACAMGTIGSGSAFLSLGTSGVLFAANDRYRPNAESAVHAFCHALPDSWHQMGVILAATDSLNWLAGIAGTTPHALAAGVASAKSTDLLFLPYLGGERTPHNDARARGVFIGLGHDTDIADMTRAVMQGVGFAFKDCQRALRESGTTLGVTFAIGGGSKSAAWLGMLASILDLPLLTIDDGQVGAGLGAARLGLIAATGADPASVCHQPDVAERFEPGDPGEYESAYRRYRASYQALKQGELFTSQQD